MAERWLDEEQQRAWRAWLTVAELVPRCGEADVGAALLGGAVVAGLRDWDDHRVLFNVLLGRPARARTDRLVPYTVFTDPQVAGVGLSEQAARAKGLAVEVASMPFGDIARAIETDETAGVLKVVIDAKTERVVGAFIVGVDAGELIHVFSVLMKAEGSARAIVDGEFVHPTFAEGLQTAVMKLPRYSLS